jgi:hypothetical protein
MRLGGGSPPRIVTARRAAGSSMLLPASEGLFRLLGPQEAGSVVIEAAGGESSVLAPSSGCAGPDGNVVAGRHVPVWLAVGLADGML